MSLPNELIPLDGIVFKIDLAAKKTGQAISGQFISHAGKFYFREKVTRGSIYGVWFGTE